MAEQSTAPRSRFTPVRAAQLYDAVLGLLREVGYEALSMEAVATRALFPGIGVRGERISDSSDALAAEAVSTGRPGRCPA
ncbi:hypothetical protein ACWD4O_40930 [Streptomyces sp. NPDC002623]